MQAGWIITIILWDWKVLTASHKPKHLRQQALIVLQRPELEHTLEYTAHILGTE